MRSLWRRWSNASFNLPVAGFALTAYLTIGCVSGLASAITIGAPGIVNDGDCAPFGCTIEYQQVYGSTQFAGPISITDITFFNNNFVPGTIASANYTISLSTTSAVVNGLDTTFANNLGADNAVFFSGAVGGLIGPTNQFTIAGTPFLYNPTGGNLLLTVTSDGDGLQFSVFLDYLSNAPPGTFSRVSSFDLSGIADTVQNDTGLVTRFDYSASASPTPEPGTFLLILGGSAFVMLRRLRSRGFAGRPVSVQLSIGLMALLLTSIAFSQSKDCPSLTNPPSFLVNGDAELCLIKSPRQVDTWLLSANAGDWIVLTATRTDPSSSFFPAIQVTGPDGQVVTGALGHHDVALINVTAPLSGTYTVQISSNAGQGGAPFDGTGPYYLVLAQAPEAFDVPSGDDGGPMINGHSHQGSLTVGDIDMWSFHANQGDWLFLSIGKRSDDNGLFWPRIQLIDPSGQPVAGAQGPNVAQINIPAAATGTYTVLVTSNTGQGGTPFDGAGSYSLTLAESPESFLVLPGEDGGALQVGSGNAGTIDVGDIDIWNLNARSGDTISIRVDKITDSNGAFWPNIQLIGPDGQLVAGAHNQTSAQFSVQAPESGAYTVLISSNTGQGGTPFDGSGAYQITSSHAGSGGGGGSASEPQSDGETLGDPQDQPGGCSCGNPMNTATGNKFQPAKDYETAGLNKLSFVRYYNSSVSNGPATFATTLGANWRGSYDRYIRIVSASSVLAERADGQVLSFALNAGVWSSNTDIDLKLTHSGSGIGSIWTLKDRNDAVETFQTISASEAILTAIQARNGYTRNLQYDGSNHLTSVVDSFGRTLQFTYVGGLLQTLNTPDGLTLTYGYNSSGGTTGVNDRLASVTYSTSPLTSQQYLYENPSFAFALTGIVDEAGNRFATWTYDSTGRATSSQHAGGADLTLVTYNADGSRMVTNALGQQEVYTFATLQGVPKVTQISRLASATTAPATRAFTYDANGYKSGETDWNGRLTTYVRDARGLPVSITEASGTPQARTTTITYDAGFHLPVKIVEPGLTTDLTYDASGNLLTRTLTDTTSTSVPYSTSGTRRVWTNTWGAFGLLASTKGPRTDVNQTGTFAYDGSGTLIRTTNALGQQTQVTQHTPGGLPQTIVDANGVTMQLAYDARLRLSTSTVNTGAGALTTSYAYDAAGNILSVTPPDGSKLTNSYDMAHRMTGVTDLFNQVTAYALDALGDRTAVNVKDAGNTLKRVHSATFDVLGRLTQDTGGAGQATRYAYDSNGNALTITDPLNRVTTQNFDALNRRVRITDPLNGVTATTYDEHNRPLTVSAPNGAVTSYVYDGFGDLIQETSPDRGKTVYSYDLAGNLTQVIDARNIVRNNAYDALDRWISTTYPGGASENVTVTYDQAGHGFGVGRLTGVIDEAGTLNRSYDERGNITTETRTRGAVVQTTNYTYDPSSRIASVKYPSGAIAAYVRDTMGRITGVTMKLQGAAGGLNVVSNIGYQPFGPVTALAFGNGVNGTRNFDLDYRLANLADGGIQNLTYSYNAADDVTSIIDGINSASNQSFGYDALDRLASASGVYGSLAWTYDANGNRLTQTAGGTATTYVYTPQSNRLTQVKTGSATQVLSYTPAGAITSIANVPGTRPAQGIAYNQAGRLQRVLAGGAQTLSYVYDAFGRRLAKTGTATTLYQYDQAGHLLEEANGSGAPITDYVYLGDQPIATFTPGSSSLAFLHSDRLGTPQKATNNGQSVVWKADYLPFGELNAGTSQTTTLAQSLRLPGQEFEAESGWHQNGFRDYAPSLGRYVESDPIGLGGGENTYSYTRGNPIRLKDQMGLFTFWQGVTAAGYGADGILSTGAGFGAFAVETGLSVTGVSEDIELVRLAPTGTNRAFYTALGNKAINMEIDEAKDALSPTEERPRTGLEGFLALFYPQTFTAFDRAGTDFGKAYLTLVPKREISCPIDQSYYNSLLPSAADRERQYGLQPEESYFPPARWDAYVTPRTQP